MSSQPIPYQASPEHLASLSTPELVAGRIWQHEQIPHVAEEAREAQADFNLNVGTESPARETAIDRLSNAQSAYNILLRDILVTDEVLRHRQDDTSWLRDNMYETLRLSDRNKHYEEYEGGQSYRAAMSELIATVNSLVGKDNEDAA